MSAHLMAVRLGTASGWRFVGVIRERWTEFFAPLVPGQLGCVFDHSAADLVVGHIDVTANLIAGTGFFVRPRGDRARGHLDYDRALRDPGLVFGVRVVHQHAMRVMDRDHAVLVLVHRDAVPSQPPVLLGVLDHIESSLVVEGQVVADAAVLLQREALVRAVVLLSDADLAAVNLVRDEFHGEWNYVIRPQGC